MNIRLFALSVLLFVTSILHGQESENFINELLIQELETSDNTKRYLSGWGGGLDATDSLLRIVPFLLNASPQRFYIIGEEVRNPILKIKASSATLKEAVLPALQQIYGFDIQSKEQEVEVWEMSIADKTKLYLQQDCDAYHPLSNEPRSSVWTGQSIILEDVRYFLEMLVKEIVVNEAKVEGEFCFRIPSLKTAVSLLRHDKDIVIMESGQFSQKTKELAYQQYFLDFYGIKLEKKTVTIPMNAIAFRKLEQSNSLPNFDFKE